MDSPESPPLDAPDVPGAARMREDIRARLFPRARGGTRPPAADAAGQHESDVVAGRYRLVAPIGGGVMGVVWRARDLVDDRDVALKVLRSSSVFAGTGLDRLLREAKLAARVLHPNVVQILDCGRDGSGGGWVAMGLVEGRSLRTVLDERGRLPWSIVREVLAQVADALACAHRSDVVHRDLKPANIMVDERPEGIHVTVVDFGLARSTAADPTTAKLTGTGNVFGTPRYISPEQARAYPTDGRTDVYALGCVAYELLTGVPAFEGDSPSDVLHGHLFRQVRTFAEVAPDLALPAGVEAIVMRATRKRIENRFAGMHELRDAVLGVDTGARPVDVPEEAVALAPAASTLAPIPRMHLGAGAVILLATAAGVALLVAWILG